MSSVLGVNVVLPSERDDFPGNFSTSDFSALLTEGHDIKKYAIIDDFSSINSFKEKDFSNQKLVYDYDSSLGNSELGGQSITGPKTQKSIYSMSQQSA